MSLAAGQEKKTQGKPADPVCPCPVERLSVGGGPQTSPHGQSNFTRRSFSACAAAVTALKLDLERCAEHFLVGGLLLVGQLRFNLGEGFLAVLVELRPGSLG